MDCVFCKIMNGELPSYTVYEDDVVKVFLNIDPKTNGHSLVVPKKHYRDITEMDLETLKHVQEVIKEIYPMYKEKLGCIGMTLVQNNEYDQEVKHYHVHMIPRYQDDGLDIKGQENLLEPKDVFDKLK